MTSNQGRADRLTPFPRRHTVNTHISRRAPQFHRTSRRAFEQYETQGPVRTQEAA